MISWPINWREVVDEAVRRRKDEGLTQRSLASLAGVSVPTVNAFEQGEINLRFERIVAILDALGLFVQPGRADSLQGFVYDAEARWKSLVEDIAPDNTARLPQGHYEQAYELDGTAKTPTLSQLRTILAGAPKTSGWPPFNVFTKESLKPTLHDGLIECWLGRPDADRFFTDPAHCDFWQVDRHGTAYVLRGYQEDGQDFEPGTIFDLTLPIWRTAEALLHAAWLGRTLGAGDNDRVRFYARYTGLAGRELLSWAKPQLRVALDERHRSRSDVVELKTSLRIVEIEAELARSVEGVLGPLYERFDGFELASDIFAGQISDLERQMRD